ncbi:MAG: hypothetical protein R2849_11565 [Thermomicrobiales bacterium]
MTLIPLQYRMFPGKSDAAPKPVDWLGGVALGATIAGLLITVDFIQGQGVASLAVLGTVGIAVVAFVATVWRQRSVKFPFIDPELLANRRYVLYSRRRSR